LSSSEIFYHKKLTGDLRKKMKIYPGRVLIRLQETVKEKYFGQLGVAKSCFKIVG